MVLNTRGGSTSAAMEIGKIIRKEKLNTYVGPKHVCASACIYVLSSGIIRMAYGDVSVHRSSFNDEFPISAMEAGADMSAVSIHKTGGSLSQSSVLLMNNKLVDKNRVKSVLNMLHSTSASYLLMASLDVAPVATDPTHDRARAERRLCYLMRKFP